MRVRSRINLISKYAAKTSKDDSEEVASCRNLIRDGLIFPKKLRECLGFTRDVTDEDERIEHVTTKLTLNTSSTRSVANARSNGFIGLVTLMSEWDVYRISSIVKCSQYKFAEVLRNVELFAENLESLCNNESINSALNKFERKFRKYFNEMIDSALTDRTAYKLSVLKNVMEKGDLQSDVVDDWTRQISSELEAGFSSARPTVTNDQFTRIKRTLSKYLLDPKSSKSRNLYRYDDAIDLKVKAIKTVIDYRTHMRDSPQSYLTSHIPPEDLKTMLDNDNANMRVLINNTMISLLEILVGALVSEATQTITNGTISDLPKLELVGPTGPLNALTADAPSTTELESITSDEINTWLEQNLSAQNYNRSESVERVVKTCLIAQELLESQERFFKRQDVARLRSFEVTFDAKRYYTIEDSTNKMMKEFVVQYDVDLRTVKDVTNYADEVYRLTGTFVLPNEVKVLSQDSYQKLVTKEMIPRKGCLRTFDLFSIFKNRIGLVSIGTASLKFDPLKSLSATNTTSLFELQIGESTLEPPGFVESELNKHFVRLDMSKYDTRSDDMTIKFRMDEFVVEFEFLYKRITGFEEDQAEQALSTAAEYDADAADAADGAAGEAAEAGEAEEAGEAGEAEQAEEAGAYTGEEVELRFRKPASIKEKELEQTNITYVSRAVHLVKLLRFAMQDNAFKSGIGPNNVYYSQEAGEEGMIIVVCDHFETVNERTNGVVYGGVGSSLGQTRVTRLLWAYVNFERDRYNDAVDSTEGDVRLLLGFELKYIKEEPRWMLSLSNGELRVKDYEGRNYTRQQLEDDRYVAYARLCEETGDLYDLDRVRQQNVEDMVHLATTNMNPYWRAESWSGIEDDSTPVPPDGCRECQKYGGIKYGTVQHGVPLSVWSMRESLWSKYLLEFEEDDQEDQGEEDEEDEEDDQDEEVIEDFMGVLFREGMISFIKDMHDLRLFKSNVEQKLTRNKNTFVDSRTVYESFKELIRFADRCLKWEVIQNGSGAYELKYTTDENACLQVFFLWLHYELHGNNLYNQEDLLGKNKLVTLLMLQVVQKMKESEDGYFYVEFDVGIGIGFKRSQIDVGKDYNLDTTKNGSYLQTDFFNVDVKIVRGGVETSKKIACGLFDVWYKVRELLNGRWQIELADKKVDIEIENVVHVLQERAYAMTEVELAFAVRFNSEALHAMNMRRREAVEHPEKAEALTAEFEKYMKEVLQLQEAGKARPAEGEGESMQVGGGSMEGISAMLVGGTIGVEKDIVPSSPDTVMYRDDGGDAASPFQPYERNIFDEWVELRSFVCRLEFWKRVLARSKIRKVARVKRLASAEVVKALESNECGFKRNSEYDTSLALVYNLVAGIEKRYYAGTSMKQY